MKIRCIIHRQTRGEPKEGTLRAWVQQENRRGANLLQNRTFTKVDSAIEHCDRVIMRDFKLIDAPEIEYVIEDGEKAAE